MKQHIKHKHMNTFSNVAIIIICLAAVISSIIYRDSSGAILFGLFLMCFIIHLSKKQNKKYCHAPTINYMNNCLRESCKGCRYHSK